MNIFPIIIGIDPAFGGDRCVECWASVNGKGELVIDSVKERKPNEATNDK